MEKMRRSRLQLSQNDIKIIYGDFLSSRMIESEALVFKMIRTHTVAFGRVSAETSR